MTGSIVPLLAADEFFNHQIVETHASVLHSDYSWTEKVCGMACARHGSLSVNFGCGKYVNRNVVDGYGGASRGVEQWTVRASRELDVDPDSVDVGPLRYEILSRCAKCASHSSGTTCSPFPMSSCSRAALSLYPGAAALHRCDPQRCRQHHQPVRPYRLDPLRRRRAGFLQL